MSHTYPFPRPALTADVVVFSIAEAGLQLLLIRRQRDPFKGRWALPGGFCEPDEEVGQAALRELGEETNVRIAYADELRTYSTPGRDPRGWTVSVAHLALVPPEVVEAARAGDDAAELGWFTAQRTRSARGFKLTGQGGAVAALAFDHDAMVRAALERLLDDPAEASLGLLPRLFTLAEAQSAHEAVVGHEVDKSSYRKRLLGLGRVQPTRTMRTGKHRPARLYTLARASSRRAAR